MNNNKLNYKNYQTINDFKWNSRLIVLVNINDKIINNNLEMFKDQLIERDVVILKINNESAFIDNLEMKNVFYKSLSKIIDTNKSNSIYLIGKDGKIKNEYNENINLESVIKRIDSMPMRKREMKKYY
tara:strand:+ start:256 stop:639 length:384 start_codon:yes stop_codon:yes gene_type:complete